MAPVWNRGGINSKSALGFEMPTELRPLFNEAFAALGSFDEDEMLSPVRRMRRASALASLALNQCHAVAANTAATDWTGKLVCSARPARGCSR